METGANAALRADVQRDEAYMGIALAMAHAGARTGEVPVGAIVVVEGQIIAAAHNAPITCHDPTAHAEVLALRAAARRARNYRVPGAVVYVTVEPCVMCIGALLHARVARIVFGCYETKGGALGSVYDIGQDRRGNHRVQVTGGVREAEARTALQQFFRVRRGA